MLLSKITVSEFTYFVNSVEDHFSFHEMSHIYYSLISLYFVNNCWVKIWSDWLAKVKLLPCLSCLWNIVTVYSCFRFIVIVQFWKKFLWNTGPIWNTLWSRALNILLTWHSLSKSYIEIGMRNDCISNNFSLIYVIKWLNIHLYYNVILIALQIFITISYQLFLTDIMLLP